MEDFRAKSNVLTRNTLILIDRLLSEFERLKIERITDHSLFRSLTYFQQEIEKLRKLVCENPKFDWILVADEANSLVRNDKNLTGVRIELSFKICEKGKKNWGVIQGKIGEAV